MRTLWILLNFLLILGIHGLEIPKNKINCHIHDTINITGGFLDKKGKFHYENLIYETGKFAIFNELNSIEVESHIRGCACELKPCIRICKFCDSNDEESCVKTNSLFVPYENEKQLKEISLENGEFSILEGRICNSYFIMEPQYYNEENWILKSVSKNFLFK